MTRSSASLMCCLLVACGTTSAPTARVRPATWAQPVVGSGSGVGNWFCVSSELYRCAQPSSADMRALAAFGVRSVVNLRAFHSDADEVVGTSLRSIEVPMSAGDMSYPQLVAGLRAVLAAEKPVAVHCWHGSDRTGAVCAAWRIAVDGWSPEEALEEMVGGGFGHSVLYGNLRQLIAGIEPERLRRDAGLAPR